MTQQIPPNDEAKAQANARLCWGVGIGVLGGVSYALLGAVCPLCLIASPALIGAGLWGRAKALESTSHQERDPGEKADPSKRLRRTCSLT